jgi:4-hydroxy-tetrahydrodipicolinate synthase
MPEIGGVITAMVTPFAEDRSVDEDAARKLARHLVENGSHGLVLSGTTGESPTTDDGEKLDLLRAVRDEVGPDVLIICGTGSNDTRHSERLSAAAADNGADAVLAVTPYYNKPTQAGLIAHFTAVADATELPVMLYDVPTRAGVAMEAATLAELAAHPRIRAVKDAKGDLFEATDVLHRTSLAYYCGIDELNLPYLACGATGVLSVVGNFAADRNADLIRAVRAHDLDAARRIHASLIPVVGAIMRTSQGAIMAKAALAELGIIPHAAVRLPLLESPPSHLDRLRAALATIAVPA